MRNPIITFFILFLSLSLYSQIITDKKIAAIDSIANKYIKEYAIVGLSIGIVNNGESSTFSYGNTDIQKKYSINDSSMFHLASVSKLFTATAIMQLIEKGQLSLDDKLVDLIPEFQMRDKRSKEITIRHLLTHTSGLMWDNKLKNSPGDTSSISLFIKKLNKRKLNFPPGRDLSYRTYSNVAFDLLGIIVEKKSGKIFDEYIKENILEPLQMKRSTYFYNEIDSSLLARPMLFSGKSKRIRRINISGLQEKDLTLLANNVLNLKVHDVYGENYEHNPSANLISNVTELNLFVLHMIELYSDSQYTGILQNESIREMWTTQKSIHEKKTSIGLGWWVHQNENLGKSVFHVGNTAGFSSVLLIYPEHKFGITILSNASYAQKAVWNKMTTEIATLFINK